jgi:hypothetical protein
MRLIYHLINGLLGAKLAGFGVYNFVSVVVIPPDMVRKQLAN